LGAFVFRIVQHLGGLTEATFSSQESLGDGRKTPPDMVILHEFTGTQKKDQGRFVRFQFPSDRINI
jgi:hypothetical protein